MAEKEKLTPAQKLAIEDRGGKLLVSAAAGSGKTKVLVDRLLSYVMDPVNPANLDDFLIITYTKAAASELRNKIADKLSQRIAENPGNLHLMHQIQRLYLTQISTVHSFCSDLLRQYAYLVEIPMDFRVADETEVGMLRELAMEKVLERAYENIENRENFQIFVDTQGMGRNDKTVPEILLRIYEASRCHLNPDAWLTSCTQMLDPKAGQNISQTIWGEYLLSCLREKITFSVESMSACLREAEKVSGFTKVCAVLASDIEKLSELAAAETWDQAAERTEIAFNRLVFPGKNNEDPQLTQQIKAVREACKERVKEQKEIFSETEEQVWKALESTGKAVCGLAELIRDFSATYQKLKAVRRILDFSDLEHRTLDLLLGKKRDHITAAAKEIGKKYREIMVDEYQDSNGIQDAIFSALTEERQNCFMVGDVKQSIYRFRLANPGIFLEKYHSYVPAEEAAIGAGRKVHLSSNFRSSAGVIDAVNHVFRYCMTEHFGGMEYGDAEALVEGIPHIPITRLKDPAKPEAETELYCIQVENQTYTQEAAFTANRIKELLDGDHAVRDGDRLRRILPEDIVILLRSPGSVGYFYQEALERRGIPTYFGTGGDLLKSEEIQVIRSLLETISNPRQDIPLTAVMASPLFGFTANELAAIRAERTKLPLFDALQEEGSAHSRQFLGMLKSFRVELSLNGLASLIKRIYTQTHIESVFGLREDGENRKNNLHTFYDLVMQFENTRERGLDDFLEYLDMLESRGLQGAGQPSAGCVTIMSIHKSKGLEFPVVFLCGLSKAFNKEDAKGRVQCDQELGIGPSIVNDRLRLYYPSVPLTAIKQKTEQENLWEELRVLYVAMTRARDRLIMVYTNQYMVHVLEKLAGRLRLERKDLLLQEVKSMGEWVLLAALQRMEAGELFAVGGKFHEAAVLPHPWKISYLTMADDDESVSQPEIQQEEKPEEKDRAVDLEVLNRFLSFRYPHKEATAEPSKQTATQQKGREKDKETEENAQLQEIPKQIWRKFSEKNDLAAQYGNAMHRVMQYISLDRCGSRESVEAEILRMKDAHILTEEQAERVNAGQIAAFFASELGKRVQNGAGIKREFKFSILQKGTGALAEEEVLMQGVVDCFIEEEDGITIIDFKTDRVEDTTIADAAARYEQQVKTYGNAIGRIFEKQVLHKYLYFFRMNRFVEIE